MEQQFENIIGKVLLVGVTHYTHDNKIINQEQFWGKVVKANEKQVLLQKDNGVFGETNTAAGNVNMGWKPCFSGLAGNGCSDYCWRMAIPGIVLYNQHRSGASLLAAHYR